MTSPNQTNMQTVHVNGTVSNTGLYNTGGNMTNEDITPDDWEDRDESSEAGDDIDIDNSDDDAAGYSDDDDNSDLVDMTPQAQFRRLAQLQGVATQAAQQKQKQDMLNREDTPPPSRRASEEVVVLDNYKYPVQNKHSVRNTSPVVKKQQSNPGFKTAQTDAVWTAVKSKKGSLTFQLGAGSMIADRKDEKRQRFAKTTDIRDKAYDLLGDKEGLAKSLRKTTMCRSVGKLNPNGTPVKCSYGDRCTFAHSTGELQVRMCKFEDRCRFIYTTPSGQIRNQRNCRTCTAKHPSETDDAHIARIGICKIAKPRVVTPKPVVLPKFSKAGLAKEKVRVTTENKEKMTNDKKSSGGPGWSHMMKRSAVQSPVTQSPSPPVATENKIGGGLSNPLIHQPGRTKFHTGSRPDSISGDSPASGTSSPPITSMAMTVMKVPAEFMGQAIEMAMKLGKTNIKFECA